MSPENGNSDPRVYLAAERTFLAWIRTGLALMAFGFVVARFGLFLRELAAARGGAGMEPFTLSLPLGVGLVMLGVFVNIFSAWHRVRYVKELKEGSQSTGKPAALAIALALVLAAAGLTMAFYLGTTKASNPVPNITLKTPMP